MTVGWNFRKVYPGDRARNPQVEKFFRSDAVEDEANALVREGIQNSLDAALAITSSGKKSVNMIISFGCLKSSVISPYVKGLFDHVNSVRDKLPAPPAPDEDLRYIAFEDFNTSGLTGDPKEWEPPEGDNAFYGFFRGEGISNKKGKHRGRHGVGKMVFTVASRARAIFGVTATEERTTPMLMGTSTLFQHKVSGKSYQMDGWFGECEEVNGYDLVVPVTDEQTVSSFSSTFNLHRDNLQGLSIVVPWIVESVTPTSIIHAVVKGYFWPLMDGSLCVELNDETGGKTIVFQKTLEDVTKSLLEDETYGADARSLLKTIELAKWAQSQNAAKGPAAACPSGRAQNWTDELLSEEVALEIREKLSLGEPVSVRLPVKITRKGQTAVESSLTVYVVNDPQCPEGCVYFVRDGLLISGVKSSRRTPGYRSLVVIENGPLATFLGDAENPSHTEWQKDNVRGDYSYHDSVLKYVTNCVSNILKRVNDHQKTADPTLLLDLFSLDGGDLNWHKKRPGPKPKPALGENKSPEDIPEPKRPRYKVRKKSNGFVINRGHRDTERPEALKILMAYGVRKGNAFSKYDPIEFDVSKKPIGVSLTGGELEECSKNLIRIHSLKPDFELAVNGFDTNRDLYLNVRMETIGEEADEEEQEVIDGNEA